MSSSGQEPDSPLSDRQAIAQVVDAARQIAKAADLSDPSGGFSWESCNDQGEAPYRGRVDMTFAVPPVVDQDTYFARIAATMVASGWAPGAPPTGTAIHRDGVLARIGASPFARADGAVQLFGACRNMTDHRADSNGLPIKDQLRQG